MYYVFRDDMVLRRNNVLQAELTTDISLWDYGINWLSCKPLSVPPPFMVFSVNIKAPLLDNYFTGKSLDLYSLRLANLIKKTGTKIEVFPAKLIDKKTKQAVSTQYQLFHLLYERNGLDLKLCDIEYGKIRKLTVSKSIEKEQIPIFRLTEMRYLVLVSEEFKNILDEHNISGCIYTPISEYQMGIPPKV